ncbi:MAG: spore coat associated protein CotJA [Lachnospirales bacterium]
MCSNKSDRYENCVPFEETIEVNELARAYVPIQIICSYFEPREALINGTVFPSLYMPYK